MRCSHLEIFSIDGSILGHLSSLLEGVHIKALTIDF